MSYYTGKVYFMRPVGQLGPVKIGHSKHPYNRVSHFMTYSPVPLEIVVEIDGTRELEWNLHDCFFDIHSHREWFFESPRITELIEKLRSGVPVEQAIDLNDTKGSVRSKIAVHRWDKRRAAADLRPDVFGPAPAEGRAA